ncbi:MAG: MBL fold metallo-hydrolase [Deltaproteobacteria bacterium]|nr:MBL fold metallo-hydrolase [Deltaproteobacteria bacterium]
MQHWKYTKGLHDLGNGIFAYLQPDGSWGWSNAGLISDGGMTLLVDTLFDLVLTREMLDAMRLAVPAAGSIDVLVNTHGNGDHWYGNQLVEDAEIIASASCAEEMKEAPPQMLASLQKTAPTMGEVGAFFTRCFSPFQFDDIDPVLPTRTFEGRLDLQVEHKEVRLLEVGPAHTRGDVIVHIPEDRTLFAGDILFIGGTPIMWVGPVANWINACDLMLGMDIEKIVPGHGPITDKRGVMAVKEYFEYLREETRRRYEEGMSAAEAALDIDLGRYASWGDPERIVVNVDTLYREFSGDRTPPNALALFEGMASYPKRQK